MASQGPIVVSYIDLVEERLTQEILTNRELIEANREGIEANRELIETNREFIKANREGIEANWHAIKDNRELIETVGQMVRQVGRDTLLAVEAVNRRLDTNADTPPPPEHHV